MRRLEFITKLRGWLGYSEMNGKFKEIIDEYNKIHPIPVGYTLKYTDEWCAATVSAAAWALGDTRFPFECSCKRMIDKADQSGTWVENDDYIPKIGDLILYDWQDSGDGDNHGWPDHVGAVESINGTTLTVIEGNKGRSVATRKISIDGKYIRGYIALRFDEEQTKGGDNGIDISHHQDGIDLDSVNPDFVIIKATEGLHFIDPKFDDFANWCVAKNKRFGFYHFLKPDNEAQQAELFLNTVKPYLGKAALFLDFEADAVKSSGVYGAKRFVSVVENAGYACGLYMSASVTRSLDWSSLSHCPLWLAQYPNNRITYFKDNPWRDTKGNGAFKSVAIHQYAGNGGRVKGYSGKVDLDKLYADWNTFFVKKEKKSACSYKIRTTANLNVRNGPSTKHKVLFTAPNGTRLNIVDEQSGWGRVDNINGWLSLKYTKKEN